MFLKKNNKILIFLLIIFLFNFNIKADEKNKEIKWPTKSIKLLVGSNAGGGTDAIARIIAFELSQNLQVPVIVENKPGASNTLVSDLTAKLKDNHTLVMGVSTAHAIAPHLLKLNFDNEKDLSPVVFVANVPNILVINLKLPVQNIDNFLNLLKTQNLNFASSGIGSTQHIAAEIFLEATKTQANHISYRGSGPAMLDLMSGQVQFAFETTASAISQIKANKIKALAVLSSKRNSQLKNIPTLKELGIKNVEMSAWYGIYVSSKVDLKIQNKINKIVNKVLIKEDVINKLSLIGAETNIMSQEEFINFHKSENKKYANIIKKNNIVIE